MEGSVQVENQQAVVMFCPLFAGQFIRAVAASLPEGLFVPRLVPPLCLCSMLLCLGIRLPFSLSGNRIKSQLTNSCATTLHWRASKGMLLIWQSSPRGIQAI